MTDNNLSAVLFKKGDMRMVDRPIPEPGPGEVQLSMRKVSVCMSDVHLWEWGAIGDFIVDKPIALGHECSAVVTKLGQGVTSLKVGDRVAIEPAVPCARCETCKEGRYNVCPDITCLACPPVDGGLTRFLVHPADLCYKLPDSVSFEEGALMEPLSVALHACRRAEVSLGKSVLVCGAGPIGLCTIVCAKAMGASEIIVTDLCSERLKLAKEMGATKTVLVQSQNPSEVAQQVIDTLGFMPDCAVEASGAPFCLQMGIRALKPNSAFVLVGLGPENEVLIPILDTIMHEIDIRGCIRYKNTWPTAVQMLSSGIVDVKPMITNYYPLEKALEAFHMAKSGKAVKVVIDCEKKST